MALSHRYWTSALSAWTSSAAPSKSVSVVPSTVRSRHGIANITRPSTGEIIVIARASGSRSWGMTTWTPLVRRKSERPIGIAKRSTTSSVHAPAAITTARHATSASAPVSTSRTRTAPTRPSAPRTSPVTSV